MNNIPGGVMCCDATDELNLLPVSYTHLDVYKRQMFGCLIGFGVGIVYTVPNPLESKRLKCVGIGGAKIIVGAVLVLGLSLIHI